MTELCVSFVLPRRANHLSIFGQLVFAINFENCPAGFGLDKSHKYIDNQLFNDYTKDTGFFALFIRV
jgi:hypothetical protein